jgi:hypothetical protein
MQIDSKSEKLTEKLFKNLMHRDHITQHKKNEFKKFFQILYEARCTSRASLRIAQGIDWKSFEFPPEVRNSLLKWAHGGII